MTDFALARRNMVDGQLRPNRVNNAQLLAVLGELPRERFLPDGIAILCGLVMSTDGYGSYNNARLVTWVGVPYIILTFIVVVSLQRGNDRNNLSRLFLESPPMNLLGYVSFPMCTYFVC